MKTDIKKIGLFLKNTDGVDYLYMKHCIRMRDNLENLIKENNLSKEFICDKFKIKPIKYNDFIKGNYNYKISDMAQLNALWMEFEIEKLKNETPIQFAK